MKRTLRIFYTDPITGLLETKLTDGYMEQSFGVNVLLEKVAKLLYTSAQSNYFSPSLGSPIGSKMTMNVADKIRIELVLHDGIKQIESQILDEQATEGADLDPEQQLVSLEISNIYQGEDPTAWYIEVIVRTAANQSFFVTV